jgi:hypothetical protein
MQMSENIAELAAALAKAQAEIKASALDGTNPHFHSEYSTLTAIWDACREALTANGLSVVQTNDDEDSETLVLETTLLHSSGQWITGRLKMKPAKPDPQGLGSATTYARRYALAAMAGVAPEDDDAEAATARTTQKTKAAPAQQAETTKATVKGDKKSQYIDKITNYWKQARDLGFGEIPADERKTPLDKMSLEELETLGLKVSARVKRLADKKAAER